MIRDSMDVHDANAIEVAPLIPDPPLQRARKLGRQSALHRCWNIFSYCSRWTCLFITLAVIVLVIILCKSLLPFGWPSWIPSLSYDSTDPHIILIVTDDLGWNDVGYGKYLTAFNNNNNNNVNNDASSISSDFTDFAQLLEQELSLSKSVDSQTTNSKSSKSSKNNKKNNKNKKSRRLVSDDIDNDETNENIDNNNDNDNVKLDSVAHETESLFSDGQTFQTKTLDELAREGIVLHRFYVSQEGSSTRASILTGRHGYRMGLQSGINTGSGAHVPTSMKYISEYLSEKRSYATHLIGKWNLGYSKFDYTPTYRGFDTFVGFHQKWLDYWHYTSSDDSSNENRVGWDLWKNDKVYDLPVSERIFSTELFTDEAVNIIKDHASGSNPDRPMFMMFSAPNPRTPLDYHEKFSSHCSKMADTLRKKYCNVVQSLDQTVGAIVDELKEQNMYEKSLIIIASDNGGLICYDIGDSETCSGASNYPLRAGKGTLFEGGIRTRAMITGGIIPESRRGGVYNEPMFHVDLFSTMLGAAKIDLDDKEFNNMDGRNHFNYFVASDDSFEKRDGGVLELVIDDDGNLLRGAFMAYPYKYVIQVEEAYDGWYISPFDGGEIIPDGAQARQGEYESPRAGSVSVVDNFEQYLEYLRVKMTSGTLNKLTIDDIENDSIIKSSNILNYGDKITTNDVGITTLTYNEYLFDIEKDEGERENLADTHGTVMMNLRSKLVGIFNNMEYRMPQDSTSAETSSPKNFDNIWWPFEEKYKKH